MIVYEQFYEHFLGEGVRFYNPASLGLLLHLETIDASIEPSVLARVDVDLASNLNFLIFTGPVFIDVFPRLRS